MIGYQCHSTNNDHCWCAPAGTTLALWKFDISSDVHYVVQNRACYSGGHYRDYYADVLSFDWSHCDSFTDRAPVDFIYRRHDLQMSCSDLTTWQGTSIVVSAIVTRVTCLLGKLSDVCVVWCWWSVCFGVKVMWPRDLDNKMCMCSVVSRIWPMIYACCRLKISAIVFIFICALQLTVLNMCQTDDVIISTSKIFVEKQFWWLSTRCNNSIAFASELLQTYTELSIWWVVPSSKFISWYINMHMMSMV